MKTPRKVSQSDLEVATQLEVDASLDLASTKNKVKKKNERLITVIDREIEATKEVASAKTRVAKSLKNEKDSIDLESDSAVDMADAREKVSKSLLNLQKALLDDAKSDSKVSKKTRRSKEELLKDLEKQSPVIDYSKFMQELNKTLADAIKANRPKPIQGPPKPRKQKPDNKPKEDKPDDDKPEDRGDKPTVKLADEYKKAAQKEVDKQLFWFRRMSNSLEKAAKTSESGVTRITSKMLMGAGGFVSDKVDSFISKIPVVGSVYGGAKFVRKNFREAGDAKRKRLVKERAKEMRAQDQEKVRQWKGGNVPDKPKSDEKKDKEEGKTKTEKMIGILKEIRDAQILATLFNMGAGLVGAITRGLSSGLGAVFGAGTAFAGAMATVGALKDKFKLPSINGDSDPKTKTPKSGKPEPTQPKPDPKAKTEPPKPTPEGSKPPKTPPTPKPEPKKSWFARGLEKTTNFAKSAGGKLAKAGVGKIAGAAAKVGLRFIPFVGTALLMKDLYDIADSFGLVSAAKDKFIEFLEKGMTPEEAASAVAKSEMIHNGSGLYGQEKPTPNAGYPLVDKDKVPYAGSADTVAMGDAQAYGQMQLEAAGAVPVSTQLEKQAQRIEEVNRRREDAYKVDMQRMISNNSRSSSGATVVNNIDNSSTSATIGFNQSEYQTSHQKGSQIIR